MIKYIYCSDKNGNLTIYISVETVHMLMKITAIEQPLNRLEGKTVLSEVKNELYYKS